MVSLFSSFDYTGTECLTESPNSEHHSAFSLGTLVYWFLVLSMYHNLKNRGYDSTVLAYHCDAAYSRTFLVLASRVNPEPIK